MGRTPSQENVTDCAHRRWGRVALPMALVVVSLGSSALAQPLPPVPVPIENPISEEKRVLGKVLFWDEQLSSDSTMSCGTCHMPEIGGNDARVTLNPGVDGLVNTPDDVRGSRGVQAQDGQGRQINDAIFGLGPRVTPRTANTVINAAFAPELFWDGRATSEFVDPQTGEVSIAAGGALESQVVGPPLNSTEMAHADRDWPQITAKLAGARPLALAVNLTADLDAALSGAPSYPELFIRAFGDGAITADRIAKAIATYERTLISDQSPWDAFVSGDASAMTLEQRQGWNLFQLRNCVRCHTPPLFTDRQFHNLGLRPVAEDIGRQKVTGDPADAGKFKTQSLRNIALKPTYFHTGQQNTIEGVVDLYILLPRFPENADPLLDIVNPRRGDGDVQLISAFLEGGLLDPRVAAGEFPFDRPTLRSELPPSAVLNGGGVVHLSSDVVPRLISRTPPVLGSEDFKLAITGVNEGELVTLLVSERPPVGGLLSADETVGPVAAVRGESGGPIATIFWPVPSDGRYDGRVMYFQIQTETGARTQVAQATLFCGNGVCASECAADTNGDGVLDFGDISAFVVRFLAGDLAADLNGDGILDLGDISTFVGAFLGGC